MNAHGHERKGPAPQPGGQPAEGSAASPGRLVLVPNTLDLGSETVPLVQVLPQGVIERAAMLTQWVAENAKSARHFLKRVAALQPLTRPLQAIEIRELPRPAKGGARHCADASAEEARLAALLAPALGGQDLGLISEAGLPAVADPGAALVALAHARGVTVEPLAGPSSLMLALAASGLNGQSFAFLGYLPVEAAARAARIRESEERSRREWQTQIAIETPYRNAALLRALAESLQSETRLCVACGLTLPGGWCATRSAAQWLRSPPAFARDLPAVFLWLGR